MGTRWTGRWFSRRSLVVHELRRYPKGMTKIYNEDPPGRVSKVKRDGGVELRRPARPCAGRKGWRSMQRRPTWPCLRPEGIAISNLRRPKSGCKLIRRKEKAHRGPNSLKMGWQKWKGLEVMTCDAISRVIWEWGKKPLIDRRRKTDDCNCCRTSYIIVKPSTIVIR